MTHTHQILTTQQMAEADRLTIAAGTSGIQLMENAGLAVADAIEQRWLPCAVTVLCGPGNNGGDGLVVARLLAERGWNVRVALLGDRDALPADALHHASLWTGPIETLSPDAIEGASLVVDALFGAGLMRELPDTAAATLAAAKNNGVPIVAVDLPSGLQGDTGEALGAVPCKLTVTFFRKKPAHLLFPGRQLCGELVLADIGIPASVLPASGQLAQSGQIGANAAAYALNSAPCSENTPELWCDYFPRPAHDSHKYMRGHALVYGGYPITGASRLAAMAAARAGAGLTSIAVPEHAYALYAATLTSIMVHPVSSAEEFDALLSDPRVNALLIGPGAGASSAEALQKTQARVLTMLAKGKATVLDADAISAFQGALPLLKQSIQGVCVLTPHEGEFGRVFGHLLHAGDKLTRARLAAQACNAVIVLKGADTVIAAPDGRSAINSNAPPSLATGGSGDVLGGIILGLLAQGMLPFEAAAAGVWLHGEAARLFGPGLIAEDIYDMLPRVLSALHLDYMQA